MRDDFQAAFWAAKRAMAEAGEEAFQRHGVRSGQQWILKCLWHEDGLTPGETARRLDLATPTVTKAAMRMEAAGLLDRRPDPRDARLVRLHLTPRGQALEDRIAAEMRILSDRALAGLPEPDVSSLICGLRRIHDNLSSP